MTKISLSLFTACALMSTSAFAMTPLDTLNETPTHHVFKESPNAAFEIIELAAGKTFQKNGVSYKMRKADRQKIESLLTGSGVGSCTNPKPCQAYYAPISANEIGNSVEYTGNLTLGQYLRGNFSGDNLKFTLKKIAQPFLFEESPTSAGNILDLAEGKPLQKDGISYKMRKADRQKIEGLIIGSGIGSFEGTNACQVYYAPKSANAVGNSMEYTGDLTVGGYLKGDYSGDNLKFTLKKIPAYPIFKESTAAADKILGLAEGKPLQKDGISYKMRKADRQKIEGLIIGSGIGSFEGTNACQVYYAPKSANAVGNSMEYTGDLTVGGYLKGDYSGDNLKFTLKKIPAYPIFKESTAAADKILGLAEGKALKKNGAVYTMRQEDREKIKGLLTGSGADADACQIYYAPKSANEVGNSMEYTGDLTVGGYLDGIYSGDNLKFTLEKM